MGVEAGGGPGSWEAAFADARKRPLVLVSGASGPDAAFVNGAYRLEEDRVVGPAPCFRKLPGASQWLFLSESDTWCVGDATAKDQRQAVGWAHSSAVAAGQLPSAAHGWRVTMEDAWQEQELLVETAASESTEAPPPSAAEAPALAAVVEEADAAGSASAPDPFACREPLCLVTETTGWDHAYEPLRFELPSAGAGPGRQVQRLSLCLELATTEGSGATKRGASHAACAFTVVSAERGFAWRLSAGCPAEEELVLEPGEEDAVEALLGAPCDTSGLFCIVEPRGMLVTVSVELYARGSGLGARLWYERRAARAQCTLPLPGESSERAAKTWCPKWWRQWDREEQRRRWRRRDQSTAGTVRSGRPFTEGEALSHLGGCISFLMEPQAHAALREARWQTSERFGLAETLPRLPPKAIELLGSMMDQALDRSGCRGVHEFWERFAEVAWLPSVLSASESLASLLETGALPREAGDAAPLQKAAAGRLREPNLPTGTRVAVRWLPGSEEAARMAFLEGRVGRLGFLDAEDGRWVVVFEAHDGMLKVLPEHLRLLDGRVDLAPQGKKRCDLCLCPSLVGRMLVVGCKSKHRFCQGCLRKNVKLPRVQRCTKCLLGG